MRTFTRTVLLLALAITTQSWLASCEDDGCCDDHSYGVSGKVTDSLTALGIDSAKVTLFDTTGAFDPWLTDTAGRYTVQLYSDSATIFVRKDGYQTKWLAVKTEGMDLSAVNFQLVPE